MRGEAPGDEAQQALVEQLEDELSTTRESLQTTIEELRASNEELQSLNEELQSTTEELETSKEELQSTNEELVTVNEELRNKVEEVAAVNSDLENLISSTDVATLFLDGELRLKRFTPKATEVFNLIQADLGRPFDHVSHAFKGEDLGGGRGAGPEDATTRRARSRDLGRGAPSSCTCCPTARWTTASTA